MKQKEGQANKNDTWRAPKKIHDDKMYRYVKYFFLDSLGLKMSCKGLLSGVSWISALLRLRKRSDLW